MAGGWQTGGTASGAYPDATGQDAGKIAETDGADGWTFVAAPTGRWEVVVDGNPATAVTTPDGTDWVYGWVPE